MTDTPFRVLLDLRDLHIQSFKYVWISVSPREITTISDFKTSILHKINLVREDIKLFIRDGLLLAEETIAVLREDDTVKVQYEDQSSLVEDHVLNTNTEQKKSKKRDYGEFNLENSVSNAKKHKRSRNAVAHEEEVELNDVHIKKKKKHKHNASDKEDNVVVQEYLQNLEESASCLHEDMQSLAKKSKRSKTCEKANKIPGQDDVVRSKISSNDSAINNSSNKTDAISSNSSELQYENPELGAESVLGMTDISNKNKHETHGISQKMSDNISEQGDTARSKVCSNDSAIENSSNRQAVIGLNTSEILSGSDGTAAKLTVGTRNNCHKKKRKRRRKRKNTCEPVVDNPSFVSNDTVFESLVDTSSSSKRKHVVFSSPNPYVEPLYTESTELISLDYDESEKDIQYIPTETYNKEEDSTKTYNKEEDSTFNQPQIACVKVSTPTQPNGNLNPSFDVSLVKNEHVNSANRKMDSIIKETEKNEHKKTITGDVRLNSLPKDFGKDKLNYGDLPPLKCQPEVGTNIAYKHKMDSIIKETAKNEHRKTITGDVKLNPLPKDFGKDKLNYADLPPLKCQPEVGTNIAYKVLELDEYYSPVVSEYRIGVIRKIDPRTDEMVIELLKHHIKPGRVGKFENLEEDVIPPPEVVKEDVLSWAALIEPKLLS